MKHLHSYSRPIQAISLAIAFALMPIAKGDLLVTTLTKQFSTDGNVGLGDHNWSGFLFTTGSQAVYLSNITAHLIYSTTPLGFMSPTLYHVTGSLPSSVLSTAFTYNPLDDSGAQFITFTSSTPTILTYAFALQPLPSDNGVWRITNVADGFDGPGTMHPIIIQSGNDGLTWVDVSGGGYHLHAEVQVEAIPEPSVLLLTPAALLALAMFYRRRQRDSHREV